jgi:arylformamidase
MKWDDAYSNGPNIEGGAAYPARWAAMAEKFRKKIAAEGRAKLDQPYGQGARQVFDLFLPKATPKGLVIFIHGGYWLAFDKSSWSHLAEGATDSGWAFAIPSYPLAPETKVSRITLSVAEAIRSAAEVINGPIHLVGHSAGGHLVCRMACTNTTLIGSIQSRIQKIVSISGLHDLRPLLQTNMSKSLFTNAAEAASESPALLMPIMGTNICCWVGADERPEFLRQNALLANIWFGLGARTKAYQEPLRHHFNIIDGLRDQNSDLLGELLYL